MDSFWGNIFKRSSDDEPLKLFRSIPVFEELSQRELSTIKGILYKRTYEPGEIIFRQGAPGVGMYIIEEGVVEIVFEPTGDTLAELVDGDFFGEIALLNDTPRSATARAKTACVLWGFFQPELFDLIERNPRVGVKLMRPLSRIAGRRLIQANEQVDALREEVAHLKNGVLHHA